MAISSTAAAIIGLVTALGGTAAAGVQYEEGRKSQKKLRDDQEVQQEKLRGEADTKQKQEQADMEAGRARTQARSRQRMGAASAQGRAGTILTSPLGVVNYGQDNQQTAGKTLLGA